MYEGCPGKSGVRFHQDVTLSEVVALAELERLTRRYTGEIDMMISPDKDIQAPGVVTGKPLSLGGPLRCIRRQQCFAWLDQGRSGMGVCLELSEKIKHFGQLTVTFQPRILRR